MLLRGTSSPSPCQQSSARRCCWLRRSLGRAHRGACPTWLLALPEPHVAKAPPLAGLAGRGPGAGTPRVAGGRRLAGAFWHWPEALEEEETVARKLVGFVAGSASFLFSILAIAPQS